MTDSFMRFLQSFCTVLSASSLLGTTFTSALGINRYSNTFSAPLPTTATTSAHYRLQTATNLHAKPARLDDNEPGVLYVNDKCINCAACSYFAPETFTRSPNSYHHIVYKQPSDPSSKIFENARSALAACPVAAIRATSPGEDHGKWNLTPEQVEASKSFAINTKVNGLPLPFPKRLSDGSDGGDDSSNQNNHVWLLGHHSEKTFGAMPYLVQGRHRGATVSVMVDVPKFSKSSIRAVEGLLLLQNEGQDQDGNAEPDRESPSSLGQGDGPDFMFLTHVDDTAGHNQWKEHFPAMKRIFHAGDLGEHNWIGDESLNDVEVLLEQRSNVMELRLTAMPLDGTAMKEIDCSGGEDVAADQIQTLFQEWDSDFLILHTPGHSPGSIALLHKSNGSQNAASVGTLFTGDTYAYTTRNGGHMTGFPRYGNDLFVQSKTLECFKALSSQYDRIGCGHGHPRDYIRMKDKNVMVQKLLDIEDAVEDLQAY